MSEKIFDELQKLYDNPNVGELVQEICEYYATKDSYECGSYEDEIEPPEIVESSYILFCLQSREQILDEFSIVQKKYPELYTCVQDLHSTLLVNMDYSSLEEKCAGAIADHVQDASQQEVITQAETYSRSSENLSKALDKFYKWLHTKGR